MQLGEQRFLKCLGICFSQPLVLSPLFQLWANLVFLLLQKFEFALHVMYCCIIRAWSSDFNPLSYLQLWIGCVHQSCTVDTFLEVMYLLFQNLQYAQLWMGYDQLKLWQLFRTDYKVHPWLELLRFIKSTWPRSNYVTSTWQEVPNGFFSKKCTYCPIS